MVLPPPELPHGTLIRIGAGLSPDIEALLQGSHAPARVILIEPHPDLSKALTLRLAAWPQVTVLAVAVGAAAGGAGGAAGGGAMLNLFSNLAHCSLYAPRPALFDLLPGLRAAGAVPVTVLTVAEVMDRLGPLPHPLLVQIDAPGAESAILDGLHHSGHLYQLDVLDLRAGAEALYDGAVAAGPLRDGLEAAGFRLHHSATDDPDWPECRLLADHARRMMERRLADLSALQHSQTARIAELEGHLGTLHHEANAKAHRITELERAQDSTLTWGREQEWHAGERAARIAELEQALDATRSWGQQNEALLRDRDGRIGHLEGELAGLHQRADHDRSQSAALEQARDEAVAALAASEGRATQQGDLAAGRAAKLTATEQALAAVRLELAAKSTGLAEAEAALAAAVAGRNAAASARNAHEAKAKEQADLAAARGVKLGQVEPALAAVRLELAAKATALAEAEAALAAAVAGRNAAASARNAHEAKAKEHEAKAKEQADLAAARGVKLGQVEAALAAVRLELAAKATALTEAEAALAAAVAGRNAAASARNAHEAKAKEQADLAAARGVKLAELETALATAGQALEAKARDLAQATAAVNEAKAAVAKSAQGTEQVTAEAAKLRSAGDELTRQNRALDADLGQVWQAMTTAVRMQAIAQADLRSLQHKFTELAGLKDEQEALLRKLMPRLQEAAAQFRGLMELPGAVPSTALIDPNAGVKQQADLKPKKDKKGAKRGKKK